MLAYLFLGRVFASFMTGNILFVGLGLSQHNYGLLESAAAAILANFGGVTIGSAIIHRPPVSRTLASLRSLFASALIVEWCFLLLFTILIVLFSHDLSGNYEMQLTILVVAALAMGIQGAIVYSFDLPAVVANALTAVVIILGQTAGADIDHAGAKEDWKWTNQFRVGMILAYALGAIVVGTTSSSAVTKFIPLAISTISILFTLAAMKQQ